MVKPCAIIFPHPNLLPEGEGVFSPRPPVEGQGVREGLKNRMIKTCNAR